MSSIPCKDHLGNNFKSSKDMCEFWHIDRSVFYGRKRLGWSLEDILTKPLDYKGGAPIVHDHLGNEYPDIGTMCLQYGIGRTTYNQRIKAGWSVKKALTTPAKKIHIKRKICKDHLGNEFPSQAAMLRHYGVTRDVFQSRIDLGWNLADIFAHPESIDPRKKQTDHLGNEFDSLADMLTFWGIHEQTYRHRKKSGMPLKECLESPNQQMRECEDHLGNKFSSVDEMCAYWNIPKFRYYARLEKGKTLEEALSLIKAKTTIDDHLLVVKRMEKQFYKVTYNGREDIWSCDEIMKYYRNNVLESQTI